MKKLFFLLAILIVPTVLLAQGDGDAPQWTSWLSYVIGAVGTLFGGTKIVTWIKKLLKTKSSAILLVGQELVQFMGEIDDVAVEIKEAIAKIESIVNSDTPPTPKQLQEALEEIKDVLREMKDVPQASRELKDAAKALFAK